MIKLKAVIFDMDGVLIDSEQSYHDINKKIFKDMGLIITDSEYEPFIGGDDARLWAYVKDKFNLKYSVEELLQIEFEEDIKFFENSGKPAMDGVLKLLNNLKENNIKIGLASSSMRGLVEAILKGLKIRDYFEVIVCGDEVTNGKPEPEIFLKASSLLEVEPNQCVVIEDSTNGVKAAKSAGMKCLGTVNENSGKQDLSRADKIVNGLVAVDSHLLSLI